MGSRRTRKAFLSLGPCIQPLVQVRYTCFVASGTLTGLESKVRQSESESPVASGLIGLRGPGLASVSAAESIYVYKCIIEYIWKVYHLLLSAQLPSRSELGRSNWTLLEDLPPTAGRFPSIEPYWFLSPRRHRNKHRHLDSARRLPLHSHHLSTPPSLTLYSPPSRRVFLRLQGNTADQTENSSIPQRRQRLCPNPGLWFGSIGCTNRLECWLAAQCSRSYRPRRWRHPNEICLPPQFSQGLASFRAVSRSAIQSAPIRSDSSRRFNREIGGVLRKAEGRAPGGGREPPPSQRGWVGGGL